MTFLKTAAIAALTLVTLAGCGTAVAPTASPARQAAAVEAQGKGKLILKTLWYNHQDPGKYWQSVGAGFEVDKLGFNQRPGSAYTAIYVGDKVVAKGSTTLHDGKIYLGEDGEYVQLGTYSNTDVGRLPHGTKLNVKWSVELDWYYKHEGGVMGDTTFYLIMKQAPKKVKLKLVPIPVVKSAK